LAISALTALAATGAAYATGAITASMILTSLAVNFVLGVAVRALSPKPSVALSNRGYMTNAMGPAMDHQIIYGKVRVGGVRVYDDATGTSNNYLHRVIAFAGHEIQSFDKIYINDSYVNFSDIDANGNVSTVTDADGNSSTRYNGKMRINFHLGSPTQSADSDLVSESTKWTSAHKLSGIAYMYVRMDFDADVYPNGIPVFTAEIKGKKVYDPRNSSTAWSDNPALCLRDYLTSSYGLGEAVANIDDTLVISAANICDQTASSVTRYTSNGAFTTGSTPHDTINAILTSMGGSLWYAQGKWRVKPAYWTTPVMSLNEDDLRSSISLATRHSRRDNFNTIKGTFRGAESDWQVTDYPEVVNKTDAGSFVTGAAYSITSVGTTDFTTVGASANTVGVVFVATGAGSGSGYADANLGEDNGQVSVADIDLPFTDTSIEGRRHARIALERNRQQLTVSASFGLRTLELQVGDNIRLTNSRFGWTNKEFEVVSWNFGLVDDMDLQVNMTLRETAEAIFNEVDDGAVYQRDNTNLPSPFTTAIPQSFAAAATTFNNQDGTTVPEITFTWTVANSSLVDHYEFQWKFSTDSTYNSVLLKDPKFILSPAESAKAYDSRVRSVNALGVNSQFISSASPISTTNDGTIPNAPTSLTVSGGYAATTVEWTAPTANTNGTALKDLFQYEIYRGTSTNPTTLVGRVAGTTFSDIGLSNSTTYYYRVKALDFTGNSSAFSSNGNGTTNAALTNGTNAKLLTLSATDQVFTFDASNAANPSSQTITISAATQSTTGTISFSSSPSVTLGGSGSSRTLSVANFGSNNAVTITASVDGVSDVFTIHRLKEGGEGAGALTLILSNENHTFAADVNGNVSSYSNSGTTIKLFEGTTAIAYDGTGSQNGTFTVSFSKSNIDQGTFSTVGNYFSAGNASNMTADNASIIWTITGKRSDGTAISLTKTQSFSKSRTGATGQSTTGARGAGRWNIQVSNLPNSSASANSTFVSAIGAPVAKDQAWFYQGTEANPTAQGVWIYNGTVWNEQDEVIDGNLIVSGTLTVTNAEIENLAVNRIKIASASVSDLRSAVGGIANLTNGSTYANMHSLTIPVISGIPIYISAGLLYREDLSNGIANDGSQIFIVRLRLVPTGSHSWVNQQIREVSYTRNGYFKNGPNYAILEDILTPTYTGNVTINLQNQSFEQLSGGTGAITSRNIYRYRSYFYIQSVVK